MNDVFMRWQLTKNVILVLKLLSGLYYYNSKVSIIRSLRATEAVAAHNILLLS